MTRTQEQKLTVIELELSQAKYDASLAERRYAACDPENRLIASELEKRWEEALMRVQAFEQRLEVAPDTQEFIDPELLNGLAQDLQAHKGWNIARKPGCCWRAISNSG